MNALGRFALGAVTLALVGAALFGVWHVVVGGFINGNPRAGSFGLGLALVAGIMLLVGSRLVRRRRSPAA